MPNDAEKKGPNDGPEQGPEVTITVNGTEYKIHRGHQTVAEIKRVAGVPAANILAQNVSGQLNELPGDGEVTLKGGEVFLSYPPSSQSS